MFITLHTPWFSILRLMNKLLADLEPMQAESQLIESLTWLSTPKAPRTLVGPLCISKAMPQNSSPCAFLLVNVSSPLYFWDGSKVAFKSSYKIHQLSVNIIS